MDIKLNEDQIEISRQARRFCENESPMEYVRSMFEDDIGFTDELWNKMAEMGWMAMRIPEEYDGLNMELMDLAVVLEEMGRAVIPGPFFSTVMLAAETIVEAGSDEQKQAFLPKIASGEIKGSLALHEVEGGADIGYLQMKAEKNGEGYVLNGEKSFVPDAHVADFLVVPARTESGEGPETGITLFLVKTTSEGVSISTLPTMDGTRKLCSVQFKGVKIGAEGILGQPNLGWQSLSTALQRAQVGICAESLGGAQRAMELATEYAKERIQFDQPIGAFQAVKHLCAQMFVEVESARSILYWAAWAQDHADEKESAIAASVAKTYCSKVYRNVAANSIQVLGGTGFSWEHDIHLYIKRSKANEIALGDPVYHKEKLSLLITA